MNRVLLRTLAVVASATPLVSWSEVSGPYASDANTIALYHFNEASGSLVNSGVAGSSLDIAGTGGPTGRSGTTSGGYGAASVSGFGSSFNMLAAGDGTHHITTSANGGGVQTSGTLPQSTFQNANGAFTLEALVNSTGMVLTREYTILSHDGAGTNRGFLFRIDGNGDLSFFNGTTSIAVDLPSSGAHAYAPNNWYHVAITYNGNQGAANNASFYWTALSSSATQANLIGTGTFAADVSSFSNPLAIGTTSRNPFRFEWAGTIDEVRISDIARGAGDFLFVPEPSACLLILVSGVFLTLARRRV